MEDYDDNLLFDNLNAIRGQLRPDGWGCACTSIEPFSASKSLSEGVAMPSPQENSTDIIKFIAIGGLVIVLVGLLLK